MNVLTTYYRGPESLNPSNLQDQQEGTLKILPFDVCSILVVLNLYLIGPDFSHVKIYLVRDHICQFNCEIK